MQEQETPPPNAEPNASSAPPAEAAQIPSTPTQAAAPTAAVQVQELSVGWAAKRALDALADRFPRTANAAHSAACT